MKQVLFLCSANYYRSRFAEHLFNWLANQESLLWRADSRGLAVDYWGELGPISPFTVDTLENLGILVKEPHRHPKPLTLADLARSDLVIALKEAEHRAMLAQRCPSWKDRVEYWNIHDIDCARPEEALPVLEEHVRALVVRLRNEESEAA